MAESATSLDLPRDFSLWLVEDDEAQMSLVKLLAEQISPSIKLKGFSSGSALLEELQNPKSAEEKPVILCDLHLADMTGFDLLESVRQNKNFKAAPFLFLTGTESRESKDKAYQMGANAYLVKPFDLSELKGLLRSLVSFWAHAQ